MSEQVRKPRSLNNNTHQKSIIERKKTNDRVNNAVSSASSSSSQSLHEEETRSSEINWVINSNPSSNHGQSQYYREGKDKVKYNSFDGLQGEYKQEGFWDSDEVKKMQFEKHSKFGLERMNNNSRKGRTHADSFESVRNILTEGVDSFRRQFDPSFINIISSSRSETLYQTYTCPKCHTKQREFFSVDSVPGNDQVVSPILVAMIYLSGYWLMAIYIYGIMEGWSPLDCIYFSVITLTTAGLGDFVPTTDASKMITIAFIYVGVAMIGLLLGSLLANSMDDSTREKTHQLNVENCPNCRVLDGKIQNTPEYTHSLSDRSSILRRESFLEKPLNNKTPERNLSKMWFSERVINVGEIKVNQATCNVMAEHFENLKNNSMASVDEGDDTSPLIDLDENKIAARTPQNIFHRRHASAISTNFDLKGNEHKSKNRTMSMGFEKDILGNPTLKLGANNYGATDNMCTSESSSSESSSSSTVSRDPFHPLQRSKILKYIMFTLKDAVANSLLVIFIGAVGFMITDDFAMVDSFYFTTVLLTTVGYGDITPNSWQGKAFATFYVLVGGTVLLNNMSKISMIPLELRKQRIENAVLGQFGLYLDDASLRELASGPLMQRIRETLGEKDTMLHECTREMFLIAMLIRLGKVSEQDISQIYSVFRSLDSGNDGRLDSRDIIFGELRKRSKKTTLKEWRRAQRKQNKLNRAMSALSNTSNPDVNEYGNVAYCDSVLSDDDDDDDDDDDAYDSAPEFTQREESSDIEEGSLKRSVSLSALCVDDEF